MKILIVSAGARACGKSWTLSRLAAVMPGAVLIEQHPKYDDEHGRHYRADQHVEDPFIKVRGRLVLSKKFHGRLRGVEVLLLATDGQTAVKKIEALKEALGHYDVIWATGLPMKVGAKELAGYEPLELV